MDHKTYLDVDIYQYCVSICPKYIFIWYFCPVKISETFQNYIKNYMADFIVLDCLMIVLCFTRYWKYCRHVKAASLN